MGLPAARRPTEVPRKDRGKVLARLESAGQGDVGDAARRFILQQGAGMLEAAAGEVS